MTKEVEINLGHEYDSKLIDIIKVALEECQGKAISIIDDGGMDLFIMEVQIFDGKITIEIETYMGITVIGPESVAKKFADEVRKRYVQKNN